MVSQYKHLKLKMRVCALRREKAELLINELRKTNITIFACFDLP